MTTFIAPKLVRSLSIGLILSLVAAVPPLIGSTTYAAEGTQTIDASTDIEAGSGQGEVSATSGANRFVVWTQQPASDVVSDISFKRSTDNGATWLSTINISNNAGFSGSPRIAVSGNNVYVVWVDDTPGNNEVLLRRSSDNGASWSSIVNLSKNPGPSTDPHIVTLGSNVYVVWTQEAADGDPSRVFDILFRGSTDAGTSWGSKINLSSDGESREPEIAASGSNVYVVWTDTGAGDSFFRRSTDEGATWKSKVNLSNNVGESRDPEIAASGSSVYVVWMDKSQAFHDVLFRRSTDEGATWKSKVNLSNNPDYSDEFPKLAASGSNVYVVWFGAESVSTGESDIYVRRSTDSGATWKSVAQLSNTGDAEHPNIAVSGSNVYAVWQDRETSSADDEIFFRRSTDSGATWKTIINLSNNDQESRVPIISAKGNNVYVVWEDSGESLFKRSTDSGATWKTIKNLSNNPGNSEEQQIGI